MPPPQLYSDDTSAFVERRRTAVTLLRLFYSFLSVKHQFLRHQQCSITQNKTSPTYRVLIGLKKLLQDMNTLSYLTLNDLFNLTIAVFLSLKSVFLKKWLNIKLERLDHPLKANMQCSGNKIFLKCDSNMQQFDFINSIKGVRHCADDFEQLLWPFCLAVHGKPVLFWKGISGLKFPCFLFYSC